MLTGPGGILPRWVLSGPRPPGPTWQGRAPPRRTKKEGLWTDSGAQSPGEGGTAIPGVMAAYPSGRLGFQPFMRSQTNQHWPLGGQTSSTFPVPLTLFPLTRVHVYRHPSARGTYPRPLETKRLQPTDPLGQTRLARNTLETHRARAGSPGVGVEPRGDRPSSVPRQQAGPPPRPLCPEASHGPQK